MAEWRLFTGDVAEVSTAAFHASRDRAPHLEQPAHRPRLLAAGQMVMVAAALAAEHHGRAVTVSDLGCGDGGLLSLLLSTPEHVVTTEGRHARTIRQWSPPIAAAWGYDFTPANAAGWAERAVPAEALDVFGADRAMVRLGDVVVLTEVLEHLTDPHGALRWIDASQTPPRDGTSILAPARWLVASSPHDEHPGNRDPCHAWAFDPPGYVQLVEGAGWTVLHHQAVGRFQLLLATTRP